MSKNFWVDVALDYDREWAWIMGQSDDCREVMLLANGDEISDNGVDLKWIDDHPSGLYRLQLSVPTVDPGAEWDGNIGVSSVKQILAFPEPEK